MRCMTKAAVLCFLDEKATLSHSMCIISVLKIALLNYNFALC